MIQIIITIVGYIVLTFAAYQLGRFRAHQDFGKRCLQLNQRSTAHLDRLRDEARTPGNVELINRIAVVLDVNNFILGIKPNPPDLDKDLFKDDSVSSNP